MYLQYYLDQLDYSNLPDFLIKYLKLPSLCRLKKVGYFCGMDYASKDIYDFREYISRYDHSLTVCLLIWKLTKNKTAALAGLFHDIATPCFSHVIDYMNKDYEKQESTEEYTEHILRNDEQLKKYLEEDNIDIEDIINFKKYPVVDNERPKVCADRIDGVILTGISWTKNIAKDDIKNIVQDMTIFKNEDNEDEIGFRTLQLAQKVLEISESIDVYCHSDADNYMMELLAKITKQAIDKNYITYEDLYTYDEEQLFAHFEKQKDIDFQLLLEEFKTKNEVDVPKIEMPNVKIRDLNPIVNGVRIK